jgi:hypothetical protein
MLRVSVIIPTHNRPEKLQTLLSGLMSQDLDPADYEVIVIDDNSDPPHPCPPARPGPPSSSRGSTAESDLLGATRGRRSRKAS